MSAVERDAFETSLTRGEHSRALDSIALLEAEERDAATALAAAEAIEDALLDRTDGRPDSLAAITDAGRATRVARENLEAARSALERRRKHLTVIERQTFRDAKAAAERAARTRLLTETLPRLRSEVARPLLRLVKEIIKTQVAFDAITRECHAIIGATGLTRDEIEVARARLFNFETIWMGAWGVARKAIIQREVPADAWPVLLVRELRTPWLGNGAPPTPEQFADQAIARIEDFFERAFPAPTPEPVDPLT